MTMNDVFSAIAAAMLPVVVAIVVATMVAWSDAMVYAARMIYQAYIDTRLATGAEKMAWVVAQVKAYLPSVVAAVVSNERVQAACQSLYDVIKAYAKTYFEKNTKETVITGRAAEVKKNDG